MKRIIGIILSFSLLLCSLPSVQAEEGNPSMEIGINAETNQITVCCSGLEGFAVLTVLPKGTKTDVLDEENGIKKAIHFDQRESDKTGTVTFKFQINPRYKSGEYTCFVQVGNVCLKKDFFYFDPNAKAEAILSINEADTAEEVLLFIKNSVNQMILNLNFPLFLELLTEEKNLSITAETIFNGRPFDKQKPEVFTAFFEQAVVQNALALAETEQQVMDYIDKYADKLELNSTEGCNAYSVYQNSQNDIKERICRQLLGAAGDTEAFKTVFCNTVFLDRVCYIDYFKDLLPLMKDNLSLLSKDIFSGFEQLNDKDAVLRAVSGKSFATIQKFEEAFRGAVKTQYKEEHKSNSGNTGGGSSSGGKTVTTSNTLPSQITPSLPEPQKQALFPDLDGWEWAKESIEALVGLKIVNGQPDGMFHPADPVTREEFVKMLILALDDAWKVEPDGEKLFEDVEEDRWSFPYIVRTVQTGIVRGVSKHRFAPESIITRQDMAVMLYRAGMQYGIALSPERDAALFADKDSFASYAAPAIDVLYRKGILNGVSETRFAPEETANRAQAAKLIYEMLKQRKGE